ncbi:MAG: hypothetical protein RLZZ301_1379 [Bacteroidota bacterium]|jgi:predicted neutral ceramidase superfamily lipid hydrolase
MKQLLTSSFLSGLAIGFFTPIVFLPLIVLIIAQAQGMSFHYLWYQTFHYMEFMSRYLSLGLILNLGWFYLFLNREKYLHTRGIIFGMLLYAPYMIYVNLHRLF